MYIISFVIFMYFIDMCSKPNTHPQMHLLRFKLWGSLQKEFLRKLLLYKQPIVNDTLIDALVLSLRAKMTFKSSLIHVQQKSICFEYCGPMHLTVRGISAKDKVCALYDKFKNSFETEAL